MIYMICMIIIIGMKWFSTSNRGIKYLSWQKAWRNLIKKVDQRKLSIWYHRGYHYTLSVIAWHFKQTCFEKHWYYTQKFPILLPLRIIQTLFNSRMFWQMLTPLPKSDIWIREPIYDGRPPLTDILKGIFRNRFTVNWAKKSVYSSFWDEV